MTGPLADEIKSAKFYLIRSEVLILWGVEFLASP